VTTGPTAQDDAILDSALRHARDTRRMLIAAGARHQAADVFRELCGNASCILIADDNTFAAAGRDAFDALRRANCTVHEPLVLDANGLYAEYSFVTQIQNALTSNDAIPIAVGAGSINDLTKLASHLCGRRYLTIATAASMDGYTAFGASITQDGSKQTFNCPAPLGVVADMEIIVAAQEGLNASGYADLVAKSPAGADWILADGLGIDPIDQANWQMVQTYLREWIADPAGIAGRDYEATRRLTVALMITGFAMQAACSSRPVSGAEHQFSHLWDMEHHTHHGITPSHGFKVGIGSLASASLYEFLLATDIEDVDIESAVAAWSDRNANEREIAELFPSAELERKALLESGLKHVDPATLRAQLQLLRQNWPGLRERLQQQIIPRAELHDMLLAAGCPVEPEQIGIDPGRMRASYRKAYHIRRRFTILDAIRRANLWEPILDLVFASPKGVA
jgi:glycerol-1-phosphate dehydrogenase [NAD(P)+]